MSTTTLTTTPTVATWFVNAATVVGGASNNGASTLLPTRIKVPGYERGSMAAITPQVLTKEYDKLQRAQPNSDTVEINADYQLGPFDKTINVDTGRGDVTIVLKPATARYAQSITIVKTSTDFNNVRVLATSGDQIGNAAGLSWTDPFVAYTMRPDGDKHWWVEGVHDEAVQIAPGTYSKVVVDRKGRVRYGGPVTESDIVFSETTIASKIVGVRATVTYTTASLADGAVATATIAMAKGATLYEVTVTRAARIILYSSSAARTADAGRLLGIAATPGTGILAEFSFAAPGFIECGPLPGLRDRGVPPTTDIFAAITNQSGSTGTVQVDLLYVPTEY